MNQILTLNDGTQLEPAHAILAGGVLWVYMENGASLAEAFELLSDPDKTCVIHAEDYGDLRDYEGYTDLFCITREENGQVNAGLKKGMR